MKTLIIRKAGRYIKITNKILRWRRVLRSFFRISDILFSWRSLQIFFDREIIFTSRYPITFVYQATKENKKQETYSRTVSGGILDGILRRPCPVQMTVSWEHEHKCGHELEAVLIVRVRCKIATLWSSSILGSLNRRNPFFSFLQRQLKWGPRLSYVLLDLFNDDRPHLPVHSPTTHWAIIMCHLSLVTNIFRNFWDSPYNLSSFVLNLQVLKMWSQDGIIISMYTTVIMMRNFFLQWSKFLSFH